MSDYVVVVGAENDEEDEPSGSIPGLPEQDALAQSPKTGQPGRLLWIAAIILVLMIGEAYSP